MKKMKLVLVMMAIVSGLTVFAQPSDATVKAKATSDGSTFIKFEGTGKVHSNLTETWYIRVAVTKNKTEYAGVNYISATEYKYIKSGGNWRFDRTYHWWGQYEGIPNPTEAEAIAHLKKDMKKFLSGAYTDIVGEVIYMKLADAPKWEWHTMKSVSFIMSTSYKRKMSSTKLSLVKQDYKVRFYADEPKGEWKTFISSNNGYPETVSTETYTSEELRAIPTLNEALYEQEQQAILDGLPKVDIPKFKSSKEMIVFTHKMLRELTRDEMYAYLLQSLTPRNYLENSTVALNDNGESLVERALEMAYAENTSYAKQYCEHPSIKHQQDGMMELWNREKSRNCRISVHKIGDEFKINALAPYVLTKPEDAARIEAASICGDPIVTEEPVFEKFNIGDAVDVNGRNGWKAATVSKVDNMAANRYYVTYKPSGGAWFIADRMRKGTLTEVVDVVEEVKETFKIGDKVTTKMRGRMYNGVISKQDGDRPRFYVELEGTGAQWLNADVLTKQDGSNTSSDTETTPTTTQTFKVGDKVMGNWKGQGKWYPGTIQAKLGKNYVVVYDDGDKETTTADNLKKK